MSTKLVIDIVTISSSWFSKASLFYLEWWQDQSPAIYMENSLGALNVIHSLIKESYEVMHLKLEATNGMKFMVCFISTWKCCYSNYATNLVFLGFHIRY